MVVDAFPTIRRDDGGPNLALRSSDTYPHLHKRSPTPMNVEALKSKFKEKADYHQDAAFERHGDFFDPEKGPYNHNTQRIKWAGRYYDLRSNDPQRMMGQADSYEAKEKASQSKGFVFTASPA